MGAVTTEEIASLQREFDWVLTTEVDNVTKQLKAATTVRIRIKKINRIKYKVT